MPSDGNHRSRKYGPNFIVVQEADWSNGHSERQLYEATLDGRFRL